MDEKSPMETSSYLSYASFWWVGSLVSKGRKKPLTEDDVFVLPEQHRADRVLELFKKEWKKEVDLKGPMKASLVWTFMRTAKKRIIITMILATLSIAVSIIGPIIFLRKLIEYTGQENEQIGVGLGFTFALIISEALRSATTQNYWLSATRFAIDFRSLMILLIYEKALGLRDLGAYSVGELVNVCMNDSQRVFEAGIYSPFIYFAGVTGIAVMVLTTYLLGPAALTGCFVFFLTVPIQILFGRGSGKLRRQAIQSTDLRVRLMNEILTCIKLIKMYAWERPFADHIEQIRQKERYTLQKAGYLQSVTVALVPVLPAVASVTTFLIQAYFGNGMTAEDVFTVVALFNVLRFSIAVLPMGVKARAEAQVGFHRLRNFLLLNDTRLQLPKPAAKDVAIDFANATLYWPAVQPKEIDQVDNEASVSEKAPAAEGLAVETKDARKVGGKHIILRKVNLCVRKGELVGICGAVGSGKSSLLSTLLGQLYLDGGSVGIDGSIAYVAQQAWIQSDTLINNILFEKPYDRDAYDKALQACSLQHDIRILPAGEQTEIGERGINLSGGQKQRVNLARAVYADRDIYLLDDPLSAVDANVGQSIFDKCVKGMLSGKTILLVTHQLQYLPACDRVCFVQDKHVAVGTHEELLQENEAYRTLIEHHSNDENEDPDDVTNEKADETPDSKEKEQMAEASTASDQTHPSKGDNTKGKLIQAEEVGAGNITLQTYLSYARAGGGVIVFAVILLIFFIGMFAKAYGDFYLGYWIREGDGNSTAGHRGDPSDNPDLDMHATIYGMTLVALLVFQALKGYTFVRQTLAASSSLHRQIFGRIIRAPMSFFDTTPTGRILNRFSKDLDEIDVRLPFVAEQFLQNTALLLITMGMIAYVFPWFLVALVPISAFFFSLVRYFKPAQTQTKRLENSTRSPLLSQLSATLQGIHTIAAFEKKDAFMRKFVQALDTNTKCFFSFHYASRWFAFRLDYTTVMMIFATSLMAVLLHGHVSPELAALAISYSLAMAGMFQYTTRLSAEVEARFTSVERIHRYATETPQEVGFSTPTRDDLPKNWPAEGAITFSNVVVSYRPGLPPVLRSLSLDIQPREKIGIVGRTGAGKSTIALVLYRMMELQSGSISLDGIDIASVEASFLRSRLSIIPQDPVLFVGTIRYNVDPFSEYSDDDIWLALEQAHIKHLISGLEQGLESPVVENGENFSVGERQLLCMARALLRRSTILVMDEATAAIDTQTDALIQSTIREAFKDCTVLTVAHRLNTILDSDRVLVMDQGTVAEFDSPERLIADPSSQFSKLLQIAGISVDRNNQLVLEQEEPEQILFSVV
eukprot:m.78868 g.78868  ORF g.78868 m.78868 type:complete len:1323 (+) comp14131_c0_seq1:57-4025(+)